MVATYPASPEMDIGPAPPAGVDALDRSEHARIEAAMTETALRIMRAIIALLLPRDAGKLSVRAIAATAKASEKAVGKHLRALVAGGFLDIRHNPGQGAWYRVLKHPSDADLDGGGTTPYPPKGVEGMVTTPPPKVREASPQVIEECKAQLAETFKTSQQGKTAQAKLLYQQQRAAAFDEQVKEREALPFWERRGWYKPWWARAGYKTGEVKGCARMITPPVDPSQRMTGGDIDEMIREACQRLRTSALARLRQHGA